MSMNSSWWFKLVFIISAILVVLIVGFALFYAFTGMGGFHSMMGTSSWMTHGFGCMR